MTKNSTSEQPRKHQATSSGGRLLSLKGLAAVAAGLLVATAWAGSAVAVPVTQWEYTMQSGFAAFHPAGPDTVQAADPNPGIGGLPTKLFWGDASELSVVPTITSSDLFTNGVAVPGLSMTYMADAVTGERLETATLVTTLLLTPLSPAGPPIGPVPILFNLLAGPTAGGDVVVFDDYSALSFDFLLDDIVYTVGFNVPGLGPLSDTACSDAGADSDCVGFIVAEDEQATLSTTLTISADILAVPEPGSLAVFVAGLFGLAFVGRRASRKVRSSPAQGS